MEIYHTFLKEHGGTWGVHGTHEYWWVPVHAFNQLPIRTWKFNRPPDEVRVHEIHAYMCESNRMDGVIYLACIDGELVCYESNHRREALKGLTDMATILVDVIWNATHDQIKQEFLRLNKAISVPELYIQEETETLRKEFDEQIRAFGKQYAGCMTTSNHPQRPNFNRDLLSDELYHILKEQSLSVPELFRRLNVLNQRMRERGNQSRLTPKILEKCVKTGLWLFGWSNHISVKDLMMD